MRQILIGNVGDFAQALEDWMIDNKCNPSTSEEWERCIADITKAGKLSTIGSIDEKDMGKLKINLKDNFNVEEI
jgi:hypothetical protein